MGEAVQRGAAGPGPRALTIAFLRTRLMTGVNTVARVVATQRTHIFIHLFTQGVLVKLAVHCAAGEGKAAQRNTSCTVLQMINNNFQVSYICGFFLTLFH